VLSIIAYSLSAVSGALSPPSVRLDGSVSAEGTDV
jgi:hypothetical protein